MAVKIQPQPVPSTQPQLPAGLTYLNSLDKIFIRQKKELMEILTGFETRNKYSIHNAENQEIFFVEEESDALIRALCPQNRSFVLHMTDNNRQEVLSIRREFRCCTGCCWCADGCCKMELICESPPGKVIGKVRISDATCSHQVKVFDATDNHMYTMWATCCPCQCCCCPEDIEIPITDPSLEHRIGLIAKQWRGCCAETITDADAFCLSFPRDMAVESKLTLLGGLFLVEFLVFETNN